MEPFKLFQLIEILNLVITSTGVSIAFIAAIDAKRDKSALSISQSQYRTPLVASKNFRIAWVLGVILLILVAYFAYAVFNEPTPGQLNPNLEVYLGYIRITLTDCLLTYLVFFNYRDYGKVLEAVQKDEEKVILTTTTTETAMTTKQSDSPSTRTVVDDVSKT